MKKVMVGLVVLLAFQVCTSELSEIDGVISEHIDSDSGQGGIISDIPTDSFLGQYFTSKTDLNPISSRIENRIRHDFNSPVKSNVSAKDLSAKWTGDFYFESGDYSFKVNSDKGIKLSIDNEVILNETDNSETTNYSINHQMDGVHRIVVEYNLESEVQIDPVDDNTATDPVDDNTATDPVDDNTTTDPIDNNANVDVVDNTTPSDPVVEVDNSTPTVEVDWTETNASNDFETKSIFVSEQELEIWRSRSVSGPYKTKNDAGVNTPGDWDRIYTGANELLNGINDQLWKGETTKNEPAPKHDRIRDAAFLYLITEDAKYASPVINFLVNQASEPNAQWSNRPLIGDQGLFHTAGWMIKLLNAYSYVKDQSNNDEQKVIENWFKDGADYYVRNSQNDLAQNFPNRLAGDYRTLGRDAKTGSLDNKFTYYDKSGTGYNQIPILAKWYNNRRANMLGYVGFAGVFFNNSEWIFHSKIFFKELLKYSTFPDGTMGEYERNGSWGLPFAGVTYGTINIEMFVLAADAFARMGDFELYQYETSEGLYGTEGGKKSLELLIKNYYDQLNGIVERYALMDGTLYRIDMINELDQNRHWVNDIWFVKANLFYKNEYFTQSYTRNHSKSNPYPAVRLGTAGPLVYPWSGTGGMMPGYLFMYGGIETDISIF